MEEITPAISWWVIFSETLCRLANKTMKETSNQFDGGCLCGHTRFRATGEPSFPHLCSCRMCQTWSGAPVVAWVEFPLESFSWIGPGGEPSTYHSSENTTRGFCSKCGGTLCALDDGYDKISLTIASFDHPSAIIPDEHHSFEDCAPDWLSIDIRGD